SRLVSDANGSFCTPSSGRSSDARALPGERGVSPSTLVQLDGGTFLMGDESAWAYPGDGEGPVHEVSVSPFAIDPYTVTNSAFAEFVDATGHVTDAERYAWSVVFGAFLPDDTPDTRGVVGAEWWRQLYGANWRHPAWPGAAVEDR